MARSDREDRSGLSIERAARRARRRGSRAEIDAGTETEQVLKSAKYGLLEQTARSAAH